MPSTADRRALIAQAPDPALKLPSQAHQGMLNGSIKGEYLPENPARDQGQEPGCDAAGRSHSTSSPARMCSSKSKAARPNGRVTRLSRKRCSGPRP